MNNNTPHIESYKKIIDESNRFISIFNAYLQAQQPKFTDYVDNRYKLPIQAITDLFTNLNNLWESDNNLEDLKSMLQDKGFLKKFQTIEIASYFFSTVITLPHEIIVYPIKFTNCHFGGIDLSNRKFYNKVEFLNCIGGTYLTCQKAEFHNNLSVIGLANNPFQIQADFTECTFTGIITFSNVRFLNKVIFSKSKFQLSNEDTNKVVKFISCDFNDGADFTDIETDLNVYFHDNVFYNGSQNGVDFSGSFFYQNLDFKPKPEKDGNIINTNFIFKDVSFLDKSTNQISGSAKASFKGIAFDEEVIFDDSKLPNTIFTACKFKKKTSFANTIFVQPPRFFSAEINQNTIFYNSKFKTCKTPEDMLAYKTLQRLLHDAKVYTEGYKFFPLEQEIQRKFEINQWRKFKFNILASWLYKIFSNYGHITWLPLLWLLSVLVVFGIIFTVNNWVITNPASLWANEKAFCPYIGFLYSFQNLANPLSSFTIGVPFHPKNSSAAILGYFESLFGVILITLLVFAFKRRFQKGE